MLGVSIIKVNLGTIKRLRGRGGFTVLLSYNTCAGLIFPKKEAAALQPADIQGVSRLVSLLCLLITLSCVDGF